MLVRDTISHVVTSRFRKPSDYKAGYNEDEDKQTKSLHSQLAAEVMETITGLHGFVNDYTQKDTDRELYKSFTVIFSSHGVPASRKKTARR